MTHEMVEAQGMVIKALLDAQEALVANVASAPPAQVRDVLDAMHKTTRDYERLCAEVARRN